MNTKRSQVAPGWASLPKRITLSLRDSLILSKIAPLSILEMREPQCSGTRAKYQFSRYKINKNDVTLFGTCSRYNTVK